MSPAEAVAELAGTPRLLVALDFDGTLAPLVDEPMTARMLPEARAAVDALADTPETTVALVSGRTLHDLRVIAEHADDSAILLSASHGAEQWPAEQWPAEQGPAQPRGPDADSDLRDELAQRVAALLADQDGAWLEPKQFGFAVHTRLAARENVPAVHSAVDDLMAKRAPTWRRRAGHDILEFASRAEGKDDAVARLRAQTGATAVLFAGDDVTDEDALRSLRPRDVGVRVGAGETAAAVRVADIPQLAAMLVMLAHERTARRE